MLRKERCVEGGLGLLNVVLGVRCLRGLANRAPVSSGFGSIGLESLSDLNGEQISKSRA